MTDSHTVGLQSSMIALMRVPLKRLVVPAVAIFTSGSIAGCFAYFVVAAPSVSPTEASATGGQWRETDRPAVLDRPSNEDIVKAFRLATEGHGPVVAQDAVFNSHYQPPIGGPIPLPKRRPLPRP
jgi:hypothetical protein